MSPSTPTARTPPTAASPGSLTPKETASNSGSLSSHRPKERLETPEPLRLALRERGAHGAGLVPGQAQAARNRTSAHHPHAGDQRVQIDRRASAHPELGQRPHLAFRVWMEDALVPALRTIGELGIVADRGQRRVQNAVLPRLGILRHEQHMALPLAPHLLRSEERKSTRLNSSHLGISDA